jgi:hypothetical protein
MVSTPTYAPAEEIINHGHIVTQKEQAVNEVRADKSRATSDKNTLALKRFQ